MTILFVTRRLSHACHSQLRAWIVPSAPYFSFLIALLRRVRAASSHSRGAASTRPSLPPEESSEAAARLHDLLRQVLRCQQYIVTARYIFSRDARGCDAVRALCWLAC
jgi:hypothetical protein